LSKRRDLVAAPSAAGAAITIVHSQTGPVHTHSDLGEAGLQYGVEQVVERGDSVHDANVVVGNVADVAADFFR
jgi:hypothetical protein